MLPHKNLPWTSVRLLIHTQRNSTERLVSKWKNISPSGHGRKRQLHRQKPAVTSKEQDLAGARAWWSAFPQMHDAEQLHSTLFCAAGSNASLESCRVKPPKCPQLVLLIVVLAGERGCWTEAGEVSLQLTAEQRIGRPPWLAESGTFTPAGC